MAMRAGRAASLIALVALVAIPPMSANAASRRHRHRHPRAIEVTPAEEVVVAPAPPPQDGNAYRSGFAFGLLDLGISGTSTGISPYAHYDYGYVRPDATGPGYGYPGY